MHLRQGQFILDIDEPAMQVVGFGNADQSLHDLINPFFAAKQLAAQDLAVVKLCDERS